MTLFLTAIDKQGQTRDFFCQVNELGVAFDVLSQIVACGDMLLTAYILEDEQITTLPLEAFDGATFKTPMLELEREWQSVLAPLPEPASAFSDHQKLVEWTQQRLAVYEKHIASIERMINRFRDLLQRTNNSVLPSTQPSPVSEHFAWLLSKYEHQLTQAQYVHQLALKRLNRLNA